MMASEENLTVDFLLALYERNLLEIIVQLCSYAGYRGTSNMHLVSKSWNTILTDLEIWCRKFDRKCRDNQNFRRLCDVNGWSRDNSKKVDYAVTDFSEKISRVMSYHESGPSQRIFLGGIPNVFILHNEYLIAGMKSGFIKIWNPLDRDPQLRGTCQRILQGHIEEVFNLAAHKNKLVSFGRDQMIRVWDLIDGIQVKILETDFGAHQVSRSLLTFDGQKVILCFNDLIYNSVSYIVWDWLTDATFDKLTVNRYFHHTPNRHTEPWPAFHFNQKTLAISFAFGLFCSIISDPVHCHEFDGLLFDHVAVSDHGRLVFCSKRCVKNFTLISVDSGTVIWSRDSFLPDPSSFIIRSTLTEFGFCANLSNRKIILCSISELFHPNGVAENRSIKFSESSNLEILPNLIGGTVLSSTGCLAFLVSDSEEIIFCDMQNFAIANSSNNIGANLDVDSLC